MELSEKIERLLASQEASTGFKPTYRQIEKLACWQENTLLRTINQRRKIEVQKGLRLAKALNVNPSWLFDDSRGWEDSEMTIEQIDTKFTKRTLALLINFINLSLVPKTGPHLLTTLLKFKPLIGKPDYTFEDFLHDAEHYVTHFLQNEIPEEMQSALARILAMTSLTVADGESSIRPILDEEWRGLDGKMKSDDSSQ